MLRHVEAARQVRTKVCVWSCAVVLTVLVSGTQRDHPGGHLDAHHATHWQGSKGQPLSDRQKRSHRRACRILTLDRREHERYAGRPVVRPWGSHLRVCCSFSDRPNLAAINIVSSNNFTAHALQSAFDLLIPVQLDKLEDIIKQAMARSAQVLAQFEGELKKLEQAGKAEREEERRLAREQNGSALSAESERPDWERRTTQREKREMRKKLDDIVAKLRIVHKSVANILAAVQAFKAVREVSIIIVACAVNGRIVAELCSELFLLDDGLLRQQQPGGRGAGGRGRGFGAPYADAGRGRGRGFAGQPGAGAGPAPALAPPPAMAMAPDQNLFGRMTQLKASGKIEKELYHHFQTLRLIGNKAVHSTVLKATTVSKMNLPFQSVLAAFLCLA